jgi:hypothetical protein
MSGLCDGGWTGLARMPGALEPNNAGARDAAASESRCLVANPGMTWRDVINPTPVEWTMPEIANWCRTVGACVAGAQSLGPRGSGFLKAIVDRVPARGCVS